MGEGPLLWRTVVVTRAAGQAGALVVRLRRLGASVVELPATLVVDTAHGMGALAEALASAEPWAWFVVTSPNGAARLARVLAGRAVRPTRIAAVGPGTADALAAGGLPCDLVPPEAVSESLVASFPPHGVGAGGVLIVQAAAARPVLAEGVRSLGWSVQAISVYEAQAAPADPAMASSLAGADAVLFAAGSAVRAVVDAYGLSGLPPIVVCMGPVTASVAEELGVSVSAVADPHTLDGVVDATVAALRV
jgi:uroporphyrinogen-III synthase